MIKLLSKIDVEKYGIFKGIYFYGSKDEVYKVRVNGRILKFTNEEDFHKLFEVVNVQ